MFVNVSQNFSNITASLFNREAINRISDRLNLK